MIRLAEDGGLPTSMPNLIAVSEVLALPANDF